MASATSELAPPFPEALGPSIAYFWGPVRAHVNRVAAEYAYRLHSAPVWLGVDGPTAEPVPGLEALVPPSNIYHLRAGTDIALARGVVRRTPAGSGAADPPSEIEAEMRTVLQVPPVVRRAIRRATLSPPRSAFVLANIDRLPHLAPMFEGGLSDALLRAFRARGIMLVLTSQGRMHLPRLEFECAFVVDSLPEEEWWEAEVHPGVPVSSCNTCLAARDRLYNSCTPEFELACPVRLPLTAPFG